MVETKMNYKQRYEEIEKYILKFRASNKIYKEHINSEKNDFLHSEGIKSLLNSALSINNSFIKDFIQKAKELRDEIKANGCGKELDYCSNGVCVCHCGEFKKLCPTCKDLIKKLNKLIVDV